MNAIGIYSQDGDRLTTMDFRWNIPQAKLQHMLQDWLKVAPAKRQPVHLKDQTSMLVYDSQSGLLFVAFTLENVQPLTVFEALRAIASFLHSAFGGLSEEKVRGNLHMVSEIINECVDYGIVTQLQLHVVLDRIHSKYLAPKQPLINLRRTLGTRGPQFRSILPTENAGALEVYVDQIEIISCTIDPSGNVTLASCQGALQMKSFVSHDGLAALLKLHPFHCSEVAAQYTFMQSDAAYHAYLEDFQLHQDVKLQPTLDNNGYAQLMVPAMRGERSLMTYGVDLVKQGSFKPPVTASLVCECDPDYNKKVVISVNVSNTVLSHVQTLSMELPLPRYVEKVTCTGSVDDDAAVCVFEYDKDSSVLTAKVKGRPPKVAVPTFKRETALRGSGTVRSCRFSIKAMLQRPYEAQTFTRGLGPINLSYQIHSLAVSGMKVCFLDFLEADGSKFIPPTKDGPAKWLRTVATSTSTTFRV